MGRSKVLGGNLGGGLVSLKGLVGGCLALVANSEVSEVAVVVTLPTIMRQQSQIVVTQRSYILW